VFWEQNSFNMTPPLNRKVDPVVCFS